MKCVSNVQSFWCIHFLVAIEEDILFDFLFQSLFRKKRNLRE